MESRTFDEKGQKTFDRVEVPDLAINLSSGAMTAGGPGRVTTVRRGFADPITAASSTEAEPPDSGAGPLTYLDVTYQGSIRGNIHQQETSFHDQVRTVYGPVATWESTLEAEDPDALGDSGAVLRCNTLTARQMIAPGGADTAMELEAVGNTSVEGRTFTARGSRLTYAESKDLLILEGDGRTDAELFRQQTIGGPTTTASAQKILYWPSTRRMQVDGARSLQLDPAETPGFNTPSTAGRPR